MRLRRITDHVTTQNWLAVILDFGIVVFGVFIGLQVSNWSEDQKNDLAYIEARQRLVDESKANLAATTAFLETNRNSLDVVKKAIDALRQCESTPEAAELVTQGLNTIRSTQTLRLRHSAIGALTQDSTLLSKQSPAERERFNELRRQLSQAQSTLDWLENWPLETPVENNPAVQFGDARPLPGAPGISLRPLELAIPIDEACKDSPLSKHFYLWERVASFQIIRGSQIETWLANNIAAMTGDENDDLSTRDKNGNEFRDQ